MWLPRPVYESLPYAAVAIGLLLVAWSYYRGSGGTGEGALVLGAILIVAGVVLKLRRFAFREDTSKYDPRSLDE